MDQPLFEAQGLNGTLQVYENKAVLRHPKWTGQSDRVVFFYQDASIELHNADINRNGYFRLSFPRPDGGYNPPGASSEEHAIEFDFLNQAFFEHAKAFIEAKMLFEKAARQSPSPAAAGQVGKCPTCGAAGQPGSNVCGYCGSALGTPRTGTSNCSNVSIQMISIQQNGPMAQPSYAQPQELIVRRRKESGWVILLLIVSGIFGILLYGYIFFDAFGPDAGDFVRTAQSELARGHYDEAIENYARAMEEWDEVYDNGYEKEEVEEDLKRAQAAGSIKKLQDAMVELREGNLDLAFELASVAHEYDPENKEIEALLERIDRMIAERDNE